MCAQYEFNANYKKVEAMFELDIEKNQPLFNDRILPYKKGFVVTHKGLRKMNFSLIPSWLKEPKAKFATHNARIETIAKKPTWKKPLQFNRCLVPLTAFIEPIYTNEFAGNMVKFEPDNEEILVAAGIYDEWVNKETGEVIESFAIITTDPYKYIAKIGHDRSPLFISKDKFADWILPHKMEADIAIEYLMGSKIEPNFHAVVDRPMKPGWEKRK